MLKSIKYDKVKVLSGGDPSTTNNRMELLALINGLKALKRPCEVNFYSDSQYVVNGFNEWLDNWMVIGLDTKGVKNPDLWSIIWEMKQIHIITGHWVRGHSGIPDNEIVNTIAQAVAKNGGVS